MTNDNNDDNNKYDDISYIDFEFSGVIRINSKTKKNSLRKIQRLINKIIEDDQLELIKSDFSFDVLTEAELINIMMQNQNQDDEYN